MKLLIAALTLLCATGVSAGTPPALQDFLSYGNYYSFNKDTNQWEFVTTSMHCDKYVQQAIDDGVADTLVVEVPWDTPLWKKGPHTFKELKEYCAHAQKAQAVSSFASWLRIARNDDQGDLAAKCMEYFKDLPREHGLPATTVLPYEGVSIDDPATGDPFSGTLEDARKKFCDPKAKKYLAAVAAQEAPYRKALKGGKLDVALDSLGKAVYAAGRKELKTPEQLAKANVWYRVIWYQERSCNRGADIPYVVHRYQFDGGGKLVSQTSKNYCGNPPAAAFP